MKLIDMMAQANERRQMAAIYEDLAGVLQESLHEGREIPIDGQEACVSPIYIEVVLDKLQQEQRAHLKAAEDIECMEIPDEGSSDADGRGDEDEPEELHQRPRRGRAPRLRSVPPED